MEALIREGARLKEEIRAKQARLHEIAQELAMIIDFNGHKSAKLVVGGYETTVTLRQNVKWNQEKLQLFRDSIRDDETFFNLFKSEYKPIMKNVNAYLKKGPFAEGLEWARTVSDGVPGVDFSPLEEMSYGA